MNNIFGKLALSTGMAALLLVSPWIAAASAQAKPAVVVSLSGVDEILGDIAYLTEAAGVPDAGRSVAFLAGGLAKGLDRKKPWGGYLNVKEGAPEFVAFVPVTDLKAALATLKGQLGEPKDAGGGIVQLGDFPPIFVTEQTGWAFVAQSPGLLGDLPKDPAALLGNLPKDYDIAFQVNVQNIPREMRDMAISELKGTFERGLDEVPDGGDREATERIARSAMRQFAVLIDESDAFTVGWRADSMAKTTYIDISSTAVPGTSLARRYAAVVDSKSNFSGFVVPEAAVTLQAAGVAAMEDIEDSTAVIKMVRGRAIEEIEKSDEFPDAAAKAAAKEAATAFFDVLHDTVSTGKSDLGASLILKPKQFTVIGGVYVASGRKLETALKRFVDLAKSQPDFPGMKFNVSKYGGVDFHQMNVPLEDADPEAREIFGDSVEVLIGTADEAVYFALGKEGLSTLKTAIDNSSANANKTVPPGQFTVALLPILKFAQSVDDNPIVGMLIDIAEKSAGKDHINIKAKGIKNGSQVRIEVEEGVIKVIGQGIAGAVGGGGAPPAF